MQKKRHVWLLMHENRTVNQKYEELLEKYNKLHKELLSAQTEYNEKHSEHINTVHFLQSKNDSLNKTILKKNKQISGLLSFAKIGKTEVSSGEEDDDGHNY